MGALFIAIIATMFIVVAATVFIYNQILNIKSDLLTILERKNYPQVDAEPEDFEFEFEFEDEDIII